MLLILSLSSTCTDCVDEEDGSENEEGESSDDESEDEEPRIKDVLSNLFNAVSKERPSDLLHSMATSRDILWLTEDSYFQHRDKNCRARRVCTITHNDDVTKPRALNTFLDGLAELGFNKGVIKNKKVLRDLIEKRLPKWRKYFREREQCR